MLNCHTISPFTPHVHIIFWATTIIKVPWARQTQHDSLLNCCCCCSPCDHHSINASFQALQGVLIWHYADPLCQNRTSVCLSFSLCLTLSLPNFILKHSIFYSFFFVPWQQQILLNPLIINTPRVRLFNCSVARRSRQLYIRDPDPDPDFSSESGFGPGIEIEG